MTTDGFGQDRFVVGEEDFVLDRVTYQVFWADGRKVAVIWCHGSGETAGSVSAAWRSHIHALELHAIVAAGDFDGQHWAGPDGVTAVSNAKEWLRTTYGVEKFLLLGVSMGGGLALASAYNDPDDVVAVAAFIPMTDIANVYTLLPADRKAEIDAIYPGADYSDHSPITFAADLDPDLPVKIWHSTNDPLIPTATVDAFIAARPQTARESLGAVGHAVPTTAIPSLVGFMAAHALAV